MEPWHSGLWMVGVCAAMSAPTAALFVALAALLWSAGGVGVRNIEASAFAIAGLRSLFALPVLAALCLQQASAHEVSLSAMLRARRVQLAALAYAFLVSCFVIAAKRTTAANAIFLEYTSPIYIAFLSWKFLGERIRRWDVVAIVGCFFGLGCCVGGSLGGGRIDGDFIALLSGVAFGVMPVIMLLERRALHARGCDAAGDMVPVVALTLGNALTAGVMLSVTGLSHAAMPADSRSWLIVAAMGVLQIGVPYGLYGLAIPHLRAVQSTLIAMLEPVLSPVWVFLVNGEIPGLGTLAGGALIVSSLVVQAVWSANAQRLEKKPRP